MDYKDAKADLISAWGALGSSWGISRTVAQIHALLMIAPSPMSTDEIMEDLQISRGNVSMSLKTLIEWGIVFKVYLPGERKEFYRSEKDTWKLATQVAKERRRRELEPVINILSEIQNVEKGKKEDREELNKMSKDLLKFAKQCDGVLNGFIRAERSTFFGTILKFFK